MDRLKKPAIAIIILALVLLLIVLAVVTTQRYKKPMQQKSITMVTLAPIKQYTIPQTVTSYGTTVSPESVLLTAQSSGVVSAIHFKPGQPVKEGQVLFSIRVSDVSTQPRKLKAIMTTSKGYYDRLMQMNQRQEGAVSKFDLIKAKSQYEQDRATYEEAKTLEDITSPINGIVADTDLTLGSFVDSGAGLVHVVNPTSLQLKYSLQSQYAHQAHIGQKVLFYPNNAKHAYSAKVAYISPLLNAADYTLTLRANFDKPQPLRPYLFGKVEQIINEQYKTLAVPQGLVMTDAQGFYVYSVDHGKVIKQYFQAGPVSKNGLIRVISGVTSKTLIITSDISSLNAGQKVKVKSP